VAGTGRWVDLHQGSAAIALTQAPNQRAFGTLHLAGRARVQCAAGGAAAGAAGGAADRSGPAGFRDGRTAGRRGRSTCEREWGRERQGFECWVNPLRGAEDQGCSREGLAGGAGGQVSLRAVGSQGREHRLWGLGVDGTGTRSTGRGKGSSRSGSRARRRRSGGVDGTGTRGSGSGTGTGSSRSGSRRGSSSRSGSRARDVGSRG
jgi:hypothetical protein